MLDDDDCRHPSSSLTYAMVLPDYAGGRNLWRRCNVSANFPYLFDVSYVVTAVRDAFNCGPPPPPSGGGGEEENDDDSVVRRGGCA